ncbi:MAG: 50S ribosome-binding GTPase [Planctomycetes bacterium]|nr:50S ribosome-binding GTPase [Planctomycetota bacterium]
MERGFSGDTIVAPITAPSSAKRQALRLSGQDVPEVYEKLFPKQGVFKYSARELSLKLDLGDNEEVDLKLLVLTMPDKCSFTFEPVLELHLPANEFVCSKLLDRLYASGVRPAEPGEFSRRAFLNGRLNLSQTQGIAALVAATNEEERKEALRVMASAEGDLLADLKKLLFRFRRNIEAILDFPEEPDIDAMEFRWQEDLSRLETFLSSKEGSRERKVDRGAQLSVLVLGPANAGKSSLLKCLIPGALPVVTHMPGTTLDLVPYQLDLGKHSVILYDSPGFKEAENALDAQSLAKLEKRLHAFDAYLILNPADDDSFAAPKNLPEHCPKLLLRSKADLLKGQHNLNPGELPFSSLMHLGWDELKDWLSARAKDYAKRSLSPWNALEKRVLSKTKDCMPVLKELLLNECPSEDLAAYELDELLENLNALIYGDGGSEALLDSIFRDFCIGK